MRNHVVFIGTETQYLSSDAVSFPTLWERVPRSNNVRQVLPDIVSFDPVMKTKDAVDLTQPVISDIITKLRNHQHIVKLMQATADEQASSARELADKELHDYQADGDMQLVKGNGENVAPPLTSLDFDSEPDQGGATSNSVQVATREDFKVGYRDGNLIWNDTTLFRKPITLSKAVKTGTVLVVAKAKVMDNSSIEFVCNNARKVHCFTDLLSPNLYQLRVIYSSNGTLTPFKLPITVLSHRTQPSFSNTAQPNKYYTISFVLARTPESRNDGNRIMAEIEKDLMSVNQETPKIFKLPIAPETARLNLSADKYDNVPAPKVIFRTGHFERPTYEAYLPEGRSSRASTLAIITYRSPLDSLPPTFEVINDTEHWFEVGDLTTRKEGQQFLTGVKVLQRAGSSIQFSKVENGFYKFGLQGRQGNYTTSTVINVEILAVTSSSKLKFPKTLKSAVNLVLHNETKPVVELASSEQFFSEDKPKSTTLENLKGDKEEHKEYEVRSENKNASESHQSTSTSYEIDKIFGTEFVGTTTEQTEENDYLRSEGDLEKETASISSKMTNKSDEADKFSVVVAPLEITTESLKHNNENSENITDDDSSGASPEVLPDISFADVVEEITDQKNPVSGTMEIEKIEIDSIATEEPLYNDEVTDSTTTEEPLYNYEGTGSTTTEEQKPFGMEIKQVTQMESEHSEIANTFATQITTTEGTVYVQSLSQTITDAEAVMDVTTSRVPDSLTTTAVTQETISLDDKTGELKEDQSASVKLEETVVESGLQSRNQEEEEVEKLVQTFTGNTETTRVYNTKLYLNLKSPVAGELTVPENLRTGDFVANLEITVSAVDMDPGDLILIETNSTAFTVFPRYMQPGKTVFLVVSDATQLDYETLPRSFPVEIKASMRTKPLVYASRTLRVHKKDESDQPPVFLEKSYDFHIAESSIAGQKVGQVDVTDSDEVDQGKVNFRLIGPGSELFTINGGTISVSCPTILPCLDRERTDSYHLIVVATDQGGLSSIPVPVQITIDDENDNGPILQLSQTHIQISDGRILKPFLLKVVDFDQYPYNVNELIADGNASSFIIFEEIKENLYYAKLSSLPNAGQYMLELTVRDPSGVNAESSSLQKRTISVVVHNTVKKAHFKRTKYERTVNSEKLHKGNPLVQPEFEGASFETVRFVIFQDDPGWLMLDQYTGNVFVGDVPTEGVENGRYDVIIAAVNLTDQRVLATTEFSLTVLSNSGQSKIFQQNLYTITVSKDMKNSLSIVEILGKSYKNDKAVATIEEATISALNDKLHPVQVEKKAVLFQNGQIVLDMIKLRDVRAINFRVTSTKNPFDNATIVVYLSSDPEKVAAARKEESRPVFIHPWKPDLNILQVKLAEESPVGYVLFSLPAYDPTTGNPVTDLHLSGQMADFFKVNSTSGDIMVMQELDYEATAPEKRIFELELTAGEIPYETTAKLLVELIDIDDNQPKLVPTEKYDLDNLTIEENAKPGTVLFEIMVSDPDYLYGRRDVFKYTLNGEGANNFQVNEVNDTVAVIVSPAADLDYGKFKTILMTLKVEDSGGNSDTIGATVAIIDANNNAPIFNPRDYNAVAVENWPPGTSLAIVMASDLDSGINAQIHYELAHGDVEYFEINKENGIVSTARSLIGLARAQPYELMITATDSGSPPLSTSAIMKVRVVESASLTKTGEDKNIHFVAPSIGYVVELDENIPSNQRVYTVEAHIGDFTDQYEREVKYSIEPVDNKTDGGWFSIDSSSGDVFTLQNLDYEQQSAITESQLQSPSHRVSII